MTLHLHRYPGQQLCAGCVIFAEAFVRAFVRGGLSAQFCPLPQTNAHSGRGCPLARRYLKPRSLSVYLLRSAHPHDWPGHVTVGQAVWAGLSLTQGLDVLRVGQRILFVRVHSERVSVLACWSPSAGPLPRRPSCMRSAHAENKPTQSDKVALSENLMSCGI